MDLLPYLTELCRLFVFAILLFSAIGKARTFAAFRDNLPETLGVRQSWATPLSILLIAVEATLAIAIGIRHDYTLWAMVGALALFTGFTVFLAASLIQQRRIRCNCFGQQEEYISYLDIIRNAILLLTSTLYVWGPKAASTSLAIECLLFGMAFIAYLVITNLKNIVLIAKASNNL